MKNFVQLLAVAAVSLAPNFAHAYFIASLSGSAKIDVSKPTHILVSGRGQDLGRSPQMSALGTAARIRQTEPNAQVLLISVFEDPKNRESLTAKGAVFTKVNEDVAFNTSSLLPELLKFSKISSLHFFGHNSPTLGVQTDGPGARFDFREKRVAQLKGHFAPDAYMIVHGCNGGWYLAPMMSKALGIPVAGAFTGTHFERLHSDGHFYVSSANKAPSTEWAQSNTGSYDADRACLNGGCLRMRPANAPYDGHWGNLQAGALAFYKFFCVTNSQDDCDRAMAKSLLHSLTASNAALDDRGTFTAAAKDFVCPPSKDRALSDECGKAMQASLSGGSRTYTSLRAAPTLACSFKSCEVKFTCTDTSCSMERTTKQPATTQTDEFAAYLRGFDSLAKRP